MPLDERNTMALELFPVAFSAKKLFKKTFRRDPVILIFHGLWTLKLLKLNDGKVLPLFKISSKRIDPFWHLLVRSTPK